MMIKKIQKNKGFVILFAVTLSAILLSIALGVANVALRELKFSTSAKDTNEAFFAADSGIEKVLFLDKDGTYSTSSTILSQLGDTQQGCAKVTLDRTPSLTTIVSKGYNSGGGVSEACNPPVNSVEREIKTTY